MTVAILMLTHDDLAGAGALARALAETGRPVAVHVDARADIRPFDSAVGDAPLIRLARRRAEWGGFGLVSAALDGARALLAAPETAHVALVSGADLPLRPLAELDAHAAADPGLDLIEARPARRYVRGGLAEERHTLRHPFPWRRRRLFDACVAAQRRLRLTRAPPEGLALACGSQWWRLSRPTLERMLADPQLPALIRFFRWSWIPDESFFQSLALRWSARRADLSPTLARFDHAGRPFVFHDDHADLLARADHFFARKIDPRARRLRARLLGRAAAPCESAAFAGRAPEAAFAAARRAAVSAAPALSPAWRPRRAGAIVSAWPYLVIGGVAGALADRLAAAVSAAAGLDCRGRLFAGPDPVRALWPDQFVINLARAAEGRGAGFCMTADDEVILPLIARDPAARVIWFAGAAPEPWRERAALQRLRAGGADLTVLPARMLDDEAAAVAAIRGLLERAPP